MAGENIQFEEIKINCVQNFKKREYMPKKIFFVFLNLFIIFVLVKYHTDDKYKILFYIIHDIMSG